MRVLLDGEDVSAYVNEGMTFSNADPGGYEVADLSLPRDVHIPRGAPLLITHGLGTAWEGRVSETNRNLTTGARATRIAGEGSGALLRDGTMSMIYVDRDLGAWEQMSQQWIIDRTAEGNTIYPADVRGGADGIPALSTRFPGAWTVTSPRSASMYDAGEGNSLKTIWLNPSRERIALDDPNFTMGPAAADNVDFSPVDGFGPDYATAEYWTVGTARRYMRLHVVIQAFMTAQPEKFYGAHWRKLAVYGDHGLPMRDDDGDPAGFYASDIVGHAIGQLSTVSAYRIDTASDFAIPHASYRVPVAHEQVVADAAGYAGYHWGTWESSDGIATAGSPRFYFTAPPSAKTAWVARSDAKEVDLTERLDALYNVARIRYLEVPDRPRRALALKVVPELADAGINRTINIELGISTPTAATAIGLVILNLASLVGKAGGQVTVAGDVDTPTGPKPATLLRSGLDRLGIVDLPPLSDTLLGSTDNEFHVRRCETTVGKEGPVTQVELGTGADPLEVLNARLGAKVGIAAGQLETGGFTVG